MSPYLAALALVILMTALFVWSTVAAGDTEPTGTPVPIPTDAALIARTDTMIDRTHAQWAAYYAAVTDVELRLHPDDALTDALLMSLRRHAEKI